MKKEKVLIPVEDWEALKAAHGHTGWFAVVGSDLFQRRVVFETSDFDRAKEYADEYSFSRIFKRSRKGRWEQIFPPEA